MLQLYTIGEFRKLFGWEFNNTAMIQENYDLAYTELGRDVDKRIMHRNVSDYVGDDVNVNVGAKLIQIASFRTVVLSACCTISTHLMHNSHKSLKL